MEIDPTIANKYNTIFAGQRQMSGGIVQECSVFLATHEYGYILNSDCEPMTRDNLNKESNTNARFLLLLARFIGKQNRYHGRAAYLAGGVTDKNLLVEVMCIVKDCFSGGLILLLGCIICASKINGRENRIHIMNRILGD